MTENNNISDLWGLVWNHKWWYVACVIFCLVIAALYLYRTPEKSGSDLCRNDECAQFQQR